MKTLDFKIEVQETRDSCGPSSMKWIDYYFNKRFNDEMGLYEIGRHAEGKTIDKEGKDNGGMGGRGIIAISKYLQLKSFVTKKGDFEKIKFFVDKDLPILIDWQCPRLEPGEDAGHYSVIIGVDNSVSEKKILIADPGDSNCLKYNLDYSNFEKSWWDPSPEFNHWMAVFWKKDQKIFIPFKGRYT